MKSLFYIITFATLMIFYNSSVNAQEVKSLKFTDEVRGGVLVWIGGGTPIGALTNLSGVTINQNITLSLGTGIAYNRWNYFLPIFGDARIYLSESNISPLFYSEFGYTSNISSGSYATGGMLFSIGAGVRIKTSVYQSINLELGYVNQQYSDGNDNGPANLFSFFVGYRF